MNICSRRLSTISRHIINRISSMCYHQATCMKKHFLVRFRRCVIRYKLRRIIILLIGVIVFFGLSVHILVHRHYKKRYIPPETCIADDCKLQNPLPYSKLAPGLLLVLIHSSAKSKPVREIIRGTWTAHLKNNVMSPIQYRFVLGVSGILPELMSHVTAENNEFNDLMILPDVTDSKSTLSQRTLDGFSLAIEQFEFDYILKCDDDTVADLPRLATELQHRKTKDRLYWGYFSGAKFIMGFGPYKEAHWYICDKYTPIAGGGGYIVSKDVVDLLTVNKHLISWYIAEDATVSAALSPYNIERKHDSRFNTPGWPSRGCKDPFLITHKIEPEEIYPLYKSLIMEDQICSWRTRWNLYNGYLYNWTTLPATCCLINHSLP